MDGVNRAKKMHKKWFGLLASDLIASSKLTRSRQIVAD
jgi:hypothetical protein